MKVLILGGSRFLGPVLLGYLTERNHEITTFNRGYQKTITFPNVRTVLGDRHRPDELEKILNQDYEVIVDTSAYNRQDVELVEPLIRQSQHYIFISSVAVYRNQGQSPLNETSPQGGPDVSEYGLNKIAAEKFLQSLIQKNQSPVTILRPTYILGPKNYLYRENFFFDHLTQKRPIVLTSEKSRVSFIDVDNVAQIIAKALEQRKRTVRQAFNVGSPEVVDFEELIRIFEQVAGIKAQILYPDRPEDVAPGEEFPFAAASLILNLSKLQSTLNPHFTPLKETLQRSWLSYNSLPD